MGDMADYYQAEDEARLEADGISPYRKIKMTKCPHCEYETDNPYALEEHIDCHGDPQEE